MKVAVAGLWHLGLVTAACLSAAGHSVLGFDESATTVDNIARGQLPIFEPGLDSLVRHGQESGLLTFTSDPSKLGDADIVWITYDTPVDEADRGDFENVIDRASAVLARAGDRALVLISSQLPVGSTARLEKIFRRARPHRHATFAYSPENLRLGSALEAFNRPERVVVGIRDPADRDRITALFAPVTQNIVWTSVESAEMAKQALNGFLAMSVAFSNELAGLCRHVGADAKEVELALRGDSRIGPRAYVRPGEAIAGGTLLRDVVYICDIADKVGSPAYLSRGVVASNAHHKWWIPRTMAEELGNLRGHTISILGLGYKSGTDTLRRSGTIETGRWLADMGALVVAFDPVVKALPAEMVHVVGLRDSIEQALRGSAAVVVGADWPEFRTITPDDLVNWMRRPIVVDPGHYLENVLGADSRIRYRAVGRPN